ncbi:MAG: hypothetical protein MRY64_12270 [Hyphomonadaceae bacterium]|nr:hypothetical protein [Hyphomonadaceae bacterium]
MKLISAIPFALAGFALFTACSMASTPEAGPEADLEIVPAEAEEIEGGWNQIVGGYGPGDVSDPGAKIAYDLVEAAIYEQYPTRALVDSVALETQVVAGLNYRFRVEMTGSPESRAIYEGVVYRNLDNAYELTALSKVQ